jgi:molybdopterin synthase catalytic subunit
MAPPPPTTTQLVGSPPNAGPQQSYTQRPSAINALAAVALLTCGYQLCRLVDTIAERKRKQKHEINRKLKHKEHKKKRRSKKSSGHPQESETGNSEGEDASEDGSSEDRSPSPTQNTGDAPGATGSNNIKLITHVKLRNSKLDLGALVNMVSAPGAGAIATFSGTTRDSFDGKCVVSLEYEAYESMAERELRKIADQVRVKWPEIIHIAVEHKTGSCPIGESSVIIAISSPHRAAALDASRFFLDVLKRDVPIWKKEVYGGHASPMWKENSEFFSKGGRAALS